MTAFAGKSDQACVVGGSHCRGTFAFAFDSLWLCIDRALFLWTRLRLVIHPLLYLSPSHDIEGFFFRINDNHFCLLKLVVAVDTLGSLKRRWSFVRSVACVFMVDRRTGFSPFTEKICSSLLFRLDCSRRPIIQRSFIEGKQRNYIVILMVPLSFESNFENIVGCLIFVTRIFHGRFEKFLCEYPWWILLCRSSRTY